jgi:hypothetical protein
VAGQCQTAKLSEAGNGVGGPREIVWGSVEEEVVLVKRVVRLEAKSVEVRCNEVRLVADKSISTHAASQQHKRNSTVLSVLY